MEMLTGWETVAPLPALLLGPRSLDHRLPAYHRGQSMLPNASQKGGKPYLGFGLIRSHVVIVWPDLPEQSLLYETNILSISGVVPVVDQASPHSGRFPPVVGFWEEARYLAKV